MSLNLVIDHRRMNPINFGECRIYRFFTGVDRRILIHYGLYVVKLLNVKTVRSIQLKIDTYIKGHNPKICIDFGKFRIYSSFTGEQKRNLIYYSLWS